jgi:predicted DNA-binding transcriptional regulator YafY
MSISHDTIARRLVEILKRFNNGEGFTAQELSEEFGVSLRTIQRDLNERLAFLPIRKHADQYQLETYALGVLSYDDIRHFAHISGIDALYPDLDNGFITDLLNARVNTIYKINAAAREPIGRIKEKFERISSAQLQHRVLMFDYHDKPRTVQTYRLFHNEGIWYLIATESGTLKHFALHKITSLRETDTYFEPDDAISHLLDEEHRWFSQTPFEVELRIDEAVADYFEQRSILPHQSILRRDDTGIVMRTTVAYDEEILRHVRQWIPHIRILSPTRLQEQLEATLAEYLAE